MKTMTLQEFVDLGLLQEVNRRLLHPMGLAICVKSDMDGSNCEFDSIWDDRDDPEGMIFGGDYTDDSSEFATKAASVTEMFESKRTAREAELGY